MLKIMRGHDTEVYRVLKDMKYVEKVYRVLGEFPLFVIIQAETSVFESSHRYD